MRCPGCRIDNRVELVRGIGDIFRLDIVRPQRCDFGFHLANDARKFIQFTKQAFLVIRWLVTFRDKAGKLIHQIGQLFDLKIITIKARLQVQQQLPQFVFGRFGHLRYRGTKAPRP